LIARAIHDRSHRKDRTFVKLNCAAIPTGLLESELFGHERGAFTGAIAQKIGRLELADQGTLFLDEVGDIPIEIQPKLLRALQEREFEKLGSNRTKKVDVRLVAATNRDLETMMENREFRSDLYYRLNVFPIRIPPLRERPEDIPLLVRYFTQKYGRRMQKRIESVPTVAMRKLSGWHWPGNIRELENFIERSVILTHVVRILKITSGRVGGPDGAAARMGIKRTTLISRMTKFDINRAKYREPGRKGGVFPESVFTTSCVLQSRSNMPNHRFRRCCASRPRRRDWRSSPRPRRTSTISPASVAAAGMNICGRGSRRIKGLRRTRSPRFENSEGLIEDALWRQRTGSADRLRDHSTWWSRVRADKLQRHSPRLPVTCCL
jgi:hypothetical protein